MLVTVEPGEDFVYPTNGTTEPAVGARGFPAEAKNKLTEGVLLEGQSHIHKEDVLIAQLIR